MAQAKLFPEERYVVDTSSLVAIHQEEREASRIWERIFELVERGKLLTVGFAFDELGRLTEAGKFSPEVFRKLKALKDRFVIPQDEELILAAGQIVYRHSQADQWRDVTNPADPWIIAAAKLGECTAVTQERDVGPKHKRRIPWVCEKEGVKWIRLRHLIEREDLTGLGG